MALTKASDILGLKKAIQEFAVPIDSLSASKVTVNLPDFEATNASDALEELKLDISSLSASVLTIGNKIDDMGAYSEEETIIGTYLGSPLYRKVCSFENVVTINAGTWDSTNFTFEALGISNLNRVLSMKVNTNGATDDAFYAVYCGPDIANSKIAVFNNLGNAINIKKVVIEYTKTAAESKKKTTKKK